MELLFFMIKALKFGLLEQLKLLQKNLDWIYFLQRCRQIKNFHKKSYSPLNKYKPRWIGGIYFLDNTTHYGNMKPIIMAGRFWSCFTFLKPYLSILGAILKIIKTYLPYISSSRIYIILGKLSLDLNLIK